ncbi:MAG: hypothetical protein HRU19_32150 [Pseudobacteriovorax sp.]|nr:hypothetical protein [Pseudobacteriovorax sp.]
MHDHPFHSLAVKSLELVALKSGAHYSKIKGLFTRESDFNVTEDFWRIVWRTHPHLDRVEYCPGCDKFSMFKKPTLLEQIRKYFY